MPSSRPVSRSLVAGLAALLAGAALAAVRPAPASAAVTHRHGFTATVDGFSSWYGSYGMGLLGTAWCIDHGIRAPDPAFAYAPADLSAVAPTTQTAMAWVVGAHGQGEDPVAHAAVMLVLHDLMGAVYPSGPLDVDALTPDRLAGFGGQEAAVIERARWLKADGLAHQHLRGPLRLTITTTPRAATATATAAATVTVTVGVHDAEGRALAGIPVRLEARDAALAAGDGVTGADGTWRTTARPGSGPLTVTAEATLPRPALDAWAPTTRPAQRVARPTLDLLTATTELTPPPTTTTTTAPPTTTTTVAPTTTSTTVPATTTTTTTTVPATTTTTTTVPATTTTTIAATTTTTVVPPASVPAPVITSLPRTGVDSLAMVLVALGLVLIGSAGLQAARRMPGAPPR